MKKLCDQFWGGLAMGLIIGSTAFAIFTVIYEASTHTEEGTKAVRVRLDDTSPASLHVGAVGALKLSDRAQSAIRIQIVGGCEPR